MTVASALIVPKRKMPALVHLHACAICLAVDDILLCASKFLRTFLVL
jgi:hypothetical protein